MKTKLFSIFIFLFAFETVNIYGQGIVTIGSGISANTISGYPTLGATLSLRGQ